jgi:hypothetical protein
MGGYYDVFVTVSVMYADPEVRVVLIEFYKVLHHQKNPSAFELNGRNYNMRAQPQRTKLHREIKKGH